MPIRTSLADRAGYALLVSLGLHLAAGGIVVGGVAHSGMDAFANEEMAHALSVTLAASPASVLKHDGSRTPEAAAPVQSARVAIAASAPYYFPASELDQRPRPLTGIDLDDAAGESREGYVILKLLIDESGRVDDSIVVVNDSRDELARRASMAFGRARYAPGIRDGRAVKRQMLIEVKLNASPG